MSSSRSRRPSPSRSTAIHDAAVLTTPPAPTPTRSGPEGAILLQGAKKLKQEFFCEELPEDILHHIQSLLPVRDAARVACVSRGFLRAWRCYSKLVLNHHTLGLTDKKFEEMETYFNERVGQILENHYNNGVRVETLQLELAPSCRNIKASCLDRWLQITVKSGIKQLDLSMPWSMMVENYSFPCSVLSDEAAASSIQYLRLYGCNFYPMSTLGLLRRLTSLNLTCVHTTGEGLGHLLSTSCVLEELYLYQCSGIISLQIPSTLKQLNILSVILCSTLKVVELDAPNLCTFHFGGVGGRSETSLRNSCQLKNVTFSWILLSNAHVWLPSIASNVENLTLCFPIEDDNMPIIPSKIHHLKKLQIRLVRSMSAFHTSYDVFCLVSFLDASPVMDYFILRLGQCPLMLDLDVGDHDDEYVRRKLERRYDHLRQVTIMGFCASKSLVELTIHIIESAPSLKRLTLDMTYGYNARSGTTSKCPSSTKISQCSPLSATDLAGARKAVEAAGRYIAGRVPATVIFEVLEPCNVCHSSDQ